MPPHSRAMAWNRPWEPVEPAPTVAPRTVAPGVPVENVIGGTLESSDAGSFVVITDTHPLPRGLSQGWPGEADRRALTTLSGDPELEDFELKRAAVRRHGDDGTGRRDGHVRLSGGVRLG